MRLSNSFGFALFLLLLREKHGVFLLICLFLHITKVCIKFKRILFGKHIRLCSFNWINQKRYFEISVGLIHADVNSWLHSIKKDDKRNEKPPGQFLQLSTSVLSNKQSTIFIQFSTTYNLNAHLIKKGALDKYNVTSWLFQKSLDFYTLRGVGIGNDCMLILPLSLTYFWRNMNISSIVCFQSQLQ